jgi:hypothetical protein
MPTRPTILISSSVYDKDDLLNQVFATLEGIGYEVWMSDKGTMPVDSKLNAFENCLQAVEKCDLFLGIISGYYGSGVEGANDSITHQELSKAIKLEKHRWFLVDHDVLVIRNFVKSIKSAEKKHNLEICSKLELRQHDPISDMRILKMYDEATRADLDLKHRVGNWVQHFKNAHDVLRFIGAQLGNPDKYLSVKKP